MQSTTGTTQSAASRELLADAPCSESQRVGSFTELFRRRAASSPWEKFTHALLMPLRRYWARQQLAKVLEYAGTNGLDGLDSVRRLQKKFDTKAGITEHEATEAAIEMMLSGVIPDERWRKTLNDYLDGMQAWYQTRLSGQGRHPTDKQGTEASARSSGLSTLIKFAKTPGSAVSIEESIAVQAFMDALQGEDFDTTTHSGPRYPQALTQIYERYTSALKDPDRVVEKSRQKLATPAMQRRADTASRGAYDQLRNLPEFIHRPELVTAFTEFIEAKDRPASPDKFSRSQKRLLNQFLGRFELAFPRNPGELVALCPSVIALQDALLDPDDLDKVINLHTSKQEYKLLKGLQASRFSPSCVLALAEYLLISRPGTSMPASKAHMHRLNPESWMRLRYIYDHREQWQQSVPLGKSMDQTARDVLQRLSHDIAAFEKKFIRPDVPTKSNAADNDDM